MDTFTHIALGACIGELFTDKAFGKKAMLWGALAQSLPDIDFVAGLWMRPTEELLAHRSFTHSFLFVGLMTFFLGVAAERFHRPHNISLQKWMWFLGTEMMVHLFIDGFNNYGVGWLEPFSDHRFSFQVLFVADPFFSLPTGAVFLWLLLRPSSHLRRVRVASAGILITVLYLGYASFSKIHVVRDVERLAKKQEIRYDRLLTTPSPFNPWLHFVVMKRDSVFQVGYHSVFDKDDSLVVHPFPQQERLLGEIRDHVEVQELKKFSQGLYTIEVKQDTLIFNDLRFGQEIGWYDPSQPFAFHYYLSHPEDNNLVVQRGRFAQWSDTTIRHFFLRIAGY